MVENWLLNYSFLFKHVETKDKCSFSIFKRERILYLQLYCIIFGIQLREVSNCVYICSKYKLYYLIRDQFCYKNYWCWNYSLTWLEIISNSLLHSIIKKKIEKCSNEEPTIFIEERGINKISSDERTFRMECNCNESGSCKYFF